MEKKPLYTDKDMQTACAKYAELLNNNSADKKEQFDMTLALAFMTMIYHGWNYAYDEGNSGTGKWVKMKRQ